MGIWFIVPIIAQRTQARYEELGPQREKLRQGFRKAAGSLAIQLRTER